MKLLTPTTQSFKADLDAFGYAQIECPPQVWQAINNAMAALIAFCGQPLHHKMLIPYVNDMGYEYKNPLINKDHIDFKENCHIKKAYTYPVHFQQSEIDRIFLECCHELMEKMIPVVLKTAEMISDITKVDFLALIGDGSNSVYRPLHYFGEIDHPDWKGKDLAENHPDKGGLTFQVFQGLLGLRSYWNKKWTPMQAKPGHIFVFSGLAGQYHSRCALKATIHGAIEDYLTKKLGRYSSVLFVDFISKLKYNKQKYGPTSKRFTNDAHYDMPFEEFSQMFTEVQEESAVH